MGAVMAASKSDLRWQITLPCLAYVFYIHYQKTACSCDKPLVSCAAGIIDNAAL
jgi:hypothetical protein